MMVSCTRMCVLMWDIPLCWICVINKQLCLTALLCQCPAVRYICVKQNQEYLNAHRNFSVTYSTHHNKRLQTGYIHQYTQFLHRTSWILHPFPNSLQITRNFLHHIYRNCIKTFWVHNTCPQNTHQKVSLQRLICEVFQLARFKSQV